MFHALLLCLARQMRWIRLSWFGLDTTVVLLLLLRLCLWVEKTGGCSCAYNRFSNRRLCTWDDTSTLESLFTFVTAETIREDKALCDQTKEQRPIDVLTKTLSLSTEYSRSLQEFSDIVSRWWYVSGRVCGTRVHCLILVYTVATRASNRRIVSLSH
jgi:hypothetical protein